MKLEDYRSEYYGFSSKASDVARQLSFAGIALIWVFKTDAKVGLGVPGALVVPALLFAASLAFDLLHYVIAACIWGAFARTHEKRGLADDAELNAPSYFNWPTLFCFWVKILLVLFAYMSVFRYILTQTPG